MLHYFKWQRVLAAVFFLFLFITFPTLSQDKVGYYFDASSIVIDGYLDGMDYNSENSITYNYQTEQFENGSYYDKSGNKHDGLLRYKSDKIWYKTSLNDNGDKLKPEEVLGLTVGMDSFYVVERFDIPKTLGQLERNNKFVKHVTSYGNNSFAIYYDFQGDGSIPYYLFNKDGNGWKVAPSGKNNLQDFLMINFGHVPHLRKRIEDKDFEVGDIPTMIATAEYYFNYQNSIPIYFDKWWNQVDNINTAHYTIEVVKAEDAIMTLNFYENGHKFRSSEIKEVSPYKYEGETLLFYENDSLRKTILYKDGEKKNVKVYFPNGQLRYDYNPLSYEAGYESPKYGQMYNAVFDQTGKSLLDKSGNGTEIITDQGNGRNITRVYVDHQIAESYYGNDQRIYQQSLREFDAKIEKLNKRFSSYIAGKKFRQAVNDNAQGQYFIAVTVDSDTKMAIDYKLLNRIHLELDIKILNFLEETVSRESRDPHKFKPFKVNKEKVKYEMVFALNFGVNRFYRPSNNYNWMWLHHHQHMMMQQMQYTVPVTPPPMPGF